MHYYFCSFHLFYFPSIFLNPRASRKLILMFFWYNLCWGSSSDMLISPSLTNWYFPSYGPRCPVILVLIKDNCQALVTTNLGTSLCLLFLNTQELISYLFCNNQTTCLPSGNSVSTQNIFAALPVNSHMQNPKLSNYYPNYSMIKCCCLYLCWTKFILSPIPMDLVNNPTDECN